MYRENVPRTARIEANTESIATPEKSKPRLDAFCNASSRFAVKQDALQLERFIFCSGDLALLTFCV